METTGSQAPELSTTGLKVHPHSTLHLKINTKEEHTDDEGGYTDLNGGSKEDLGPYSEQDDEGGYTDLNGGSKEEEEEEGAYTDVNATMTEDEDAYSDVNINGVKKEDDAYSEVNIRMGDQEQAYTGLCFGGPRKDRNRAADCSCISKALGMLVLLLLSAVIAQSVLIFQHSKDSKETFPQAIFWTSSPISTVSQETLTEKLYKDLSLTLVTLKAHLCVEPDSPCQVCPNSWKQNNGWCYYISNEKQSWNFSEEYCSARHSHLLMLDSEKEMGDVLQNEELSDHFWIGLIYSEEEDQLVWLNGSSVNMTSFTVNNQTSGSNCSALVHSEIYLDECHSQKKWICEKRAYQFDL